MISCMELIDAQVHLNLKDDFPVSGLLKQMDKHGIGKVMLIFNLKEEYNAFLTISVPINPIKAVFGLLPESIFMTRIHSIVLTICARWDWHQR